MKIKAKWHTPIQLISSVDNLIYWTDINKISEKSGCYIFYNKHGNSCKLIYIGKAVNLRTRIKQQFINNVPLMMGIKKFKNGTRYLMFCEIVGKSHVKLNILEKQLIKSATLEGHTLLNIHGTRRVISHEILFNGNVDSQTLFGRKMYVS